MHSISNFVKLALIHVAECSRNNLGVFLEHGSFKDISRKVRRIPQNLGARSDENGRDRREVRRDMSEILAISAVTYGHL
eukprot:5458226-Prymnesium_polylepis.1